MGSRLRGFLIWAALAGAVIAPVAIAATSDYLAYRSGIYIAAGFAGIVAMALILIQPLLAAGYLPGLTILQGRRLHRWVGASLVAAILVHVGGLWLTSPPDVIDALTFTSPTPFSDFGVLAMWGLFAAAMLAALRRTLGIRPAVFRFVHTALAVFVVVTGSAHALLIEGSMGPISKIALCALALVATVKAIADLRSWALLTRRRRA
ncbi:MAG: ferric reductase-like transmembrane domain-containing protein [Fulvimarina manganoxydans]|uniref:ferric reductase-like transmembrane domain-containing protein n=1 Tax=Fulvimarina manganoxydans TaxID=937218 RepID=UPI00235702E2|nr:ferric reductase-like transmembrane domain-containing protein [Fulvimarina manganoxydans]MCK5931960.1 ferric reductase-like transmembrane domain-containing protein [Fulvimarina manganoxydans]